MLQGFAKHVANDHNMWAYVYYSIYLDDIDPSNHNAIEKYVYEKVVYYNPMIVEQGTILECFLESFIVLSLKS